ncbi:hypothetical protein [Rufibacter tibetensis]|uniref:Uncharacterized protein n=1 Tax=Rufibacter tibetensis TaxID=512763 RepID=A0A0P0D403_9BACT|nr:hypothetical protein [Rufibacter tibetensis]ALJ01658.1 hypothetical protein DC20_21600 [Rufibacter tibetensis]
MLTQKRGRLGLLVPTEIEDNQNTYWGKKSAKENKEDQIKRLGLHFLKKRYKITVKKIEFVHPPSFQWKQGAIDVERIEIVSARFLPPYREAADFL